MLFETKVKKPKAVLVGVPLPGEQDHIESLAELERLVTTLGFEVVHSLWQRRSTTRTGLVLGEGKLQELAILTGGTGKVVPVVRKKKHKAAQAWEEENSPAAESEHEVDDEVDEDEEEEEELEAEDKPEVKDDEPNEIAPLTPDLSALAGTVDVVVFDCELSPSQLSNLQSATNVKVLDRTGVIVEIFSKHAKTREAKLQVEIARLKYLAPRVRETGGGDRIGTAGETSIELDRRKIRDRIAELRRELVSLQAEQGMRRQKRRDQPCVALVGYTNAGKSSLMRALTGSEVLVENKLFATLDTTVRILLPATTPKILVSDTVGFIKKLPHDLVASFRSTLEEAAGASLLLFVVDASDKTFRSQLKVTKDVLGEIGVNGIPSRLILNKCDRLAPEEKSALLEEFPEAILMSAQNSANVSALHQTLLAFFERDMIEEEIFVPYKPEGLVGEIRNFARVLEERYEQYGIIFRLRAHEIDLEKLKKRLEAY